MLTVEGLVKRFGGFTAVNNVSFRVEQGEILGLIGPNGSGKSTIFNMLSGTLVPTAGSILFDGAEISGVAPHRIINSGIGRTFQIPRPFHRLSIFENVALAGYYGQGSHSRAKADEAAERALHMVGLPTDRHASVDGLGAAGLKKLELAKALATGPKLLLADESLGGLDEHEMDQAADMLRKIRDELGITIIWVEHIMGVLMRVVDRVMVLDHGEKISEGLPSAVAGDPRVIEVYLGTDADFEPGCGGGSAPQGGGLTHARIESGRRGLRHLPGLVRCRSRGQSGRGGRRDRPQRRRQDHADARDLRPDPPHQGRDRDGRPRRAGDAGASHRRSRHRPRAGEPPAVSAAHRRRQSEDGRLHAGRARQICAAAGIRVRSVPAHEGAAQPDGRHPVGRRAADVRDRPRADVGPEIAAARRAVGGSRAGRGAAGVRTGQTHPRQQG